MSKTCLPVEVDVAAFSVDFRCNFNRSRCARITALVHACVSRAQEMQQKALCAPFCNDPRRFLGGDGPEDMALYRVSGHLYTVSFDSNLGDVMVRKSFKHVDI